MIWDMALDSTFVSRVISLEWQSGKPLPNTSESAKPILIPYNIQLQSIAFHLCHGSRLFAYSKGYQTWSFKNNKGRIRSINWNPNIDTVLIPAHLGANAAGMDIQARTFHTIRNDFPHLLNQIQRLALNYCVFCPTLEENSRLLTDLSPFIALKELVLVEKMDPYNKFQFICHTASMHISCWRDCISQHPGPVMPTRFQAALKTRSPSIKIESIILAVDRNDVLANELRYMYLQKILLTPGSDHLEFR